MSTATADAISEALRATDPADALAGLNRAGGPDAFRTLQVTIERGLRGSRPAVRLYVTAYRSLMQEVLQVAHTSYPDLVVETSHRLAVVDVTGAPSAAASALLEEGAVRAPFSAWVTAFGSPGGVVLDIISSVRETLNTVEPLRLPAGASALPHWDVDDSMVLAFIRTVRRELSTEGSALDTIADTFNLNDTELGQIFGVRRQAIGQWRSEGVPARRADKVTAVASIADLLSRKLKADRLPGIARRDADAYGGLSMLNLISADRHRELLESVRESFAFSTTA